MCGIIGWISKDANREAPVAAIKNGMTVMKERGPDGSGYNILPGAAFGHRRLAVIDPAGSPQPFVDQTSGMLLVFNGEIYNFRRLRTILREKGHHFTTAGDTEVLLHAYIEWGEECLRQIDGMFAFAVFDPQKRRLFTARDPLGIKPLFYCFNEKFFCFASTIPALRCLPESGGEINFNAVSHYLTTIRTSLGRETLINGIYTQLPGESITVEANGSITRKCYWQPPVMAAAAKHILPLEEAVQRTRGAVDSSINNQLISDVPLGGFLSGGLDSTILAAVASEAIDEKFLAFGVGYNTKGYNEWKYIKEAAHKFNLNCRIAALNEEMFLPSWRHLVRSKGLPVSTPNEIAIFHLARAVKEHFTVALSGEGADELFGGYIIPMLGALDYDRANQTDHAFNTALKRAYGRDFFKNRTDHFLTLNSWMPQSAKAALLSPAVWQSLKNDHNMISFYNRLFDNFKECTTFDAYMHVHTRINLEGLLLRMDSSTMAASVEARVPFATPQLADFLFSLPDYYKINWKDNAAAEAGRNLTAATINQKQIVESKLLLRRAYAHKIPRSVLQRPKVSFAVPFREWLSRGTRCPLLTVLDECPQLQQLFDPKAINKLKAQPDHPLTPMILWPALNLALWMQECNIRVNE